MPKIALGVASSVSIYKACLVLRGFQKAGVEVQPVLTPNAARLIRLRRQTTILKAVAEKKRGQIVVGFAAETEDVRRRALAKLKDKALDFIVANDVSVEGVGFDSEFNKVILIDADGGESESPVLSKIELSRIIWDAVERHAAKKNG
jgi:phosphopantothenoylcysteine decarboxylase/phosphopantothenate--cysteine ligase